MEKRVLKVRRSLVLSLAVLATASSALLAAQAKPVDLTGVWTGTLKPSDRDPGGAYLELKQKGATLTGTAGPAADRQVAIANGKVATVKGVTSVTFDAPQTSGAVLKFDLKVVEGRLKGPVTFESGGQKRGDAVLDVGRKK
jgi:hypothetical protein